MLGQLLPAFQDTDPFAFLAKPQPFIRVDLQLAGCHEPRKLAGLQEFAWRDLEKVVWIKELAFFVYKREVVQIKNENPALKVFQLADEPVIAADVVFVLRGPDP